MRTAPKNQGPVRIALWLIYDLLWVGCGAGVFGTALLLPALALQAAYRQAGWTGVGFAALPSYILFLLGVILLMGLIRSVSPRVVPGTYEKFKAGPFFALVWLTGLNNLIFAMPFTRTVHFVALLRFLYYRGMGMKTYYENWISPEATIADPFLVTLGRGVNIGGRASMGCHLALPDKMVVAPIVIGDGAIIGTHAKVAPGVEVGAHAVIGAAAAISYNVKIGEGAHVEPGSLVPANAVIPPYERWGGHPAVRIGRVRAPRQTESVPSPEASLNEA